MLPGGPGRPGRPIEPRLPVIPGGPISPGIPRTIIGTVSVHSIQKINADYSAGFLLTTTDQICRTLIFFNLT